MTWRPNYATLNEFKGYLGIDLADTSDDVFLDLALHTASRSIDKEAGRQFGSVVGARFYTLEPNTPRRYRNLLVVQIDDVCAATGFSVATDAQNDHTWSTAISATGYDLWPYNSLVDQEPFTHLVLRQGTYFPSFQGALKITANWGWVSVPDAIKNATLIQAHRVFERRKSPYGIAGFNNGEQRLISVLDPTVAELVKPYIRFWAFR